MLEKIKLALRLTDDVFDSQINDLIAFVRKDLEDVGVLYDETDAKIINACVLKAKTDFDFDQKGTWYEKQYESLKTLLKSQRTYTDEHYNQSCN